MAHSSRFGARVAGSSTDAPGGVRSNQFGARVPSAGPAPGPAPAPAPAAPSTPPPGAQMSATGGARGVPAHYGGRHHMAGGAASLSDMTPRRPSPGIGAAPGYGSRHHMGDQIRGQAAADIATAARDPNAVAERVATEMFGADDADDLDDLFGEAEALLDEAEED